MIKVLKQNYKFILFLIVLVIVLNIRFPYYINAPGGISDMSKKIDINGYDSVGSFNLAYIKEYRATIPTLIISMFNKNWNVLKKNEVLLEEEDYKSYNLRDKILMDESISNAIYVAFNKANKDIEIVSSKVLVAYVSKEADTDLVAGDEIISINNNKIKSKNDITAIIDNLDIGTKTSIEVIHNEKDYTRYAYVINSENSKKIGILVSNIREYKTSPIIHINTEKNETGSSGGMITALTIYNSLVKEDITKGLTIVGTGTIDLDGNIGSIGGVEYKLKSAVKSKADLFIVPMDENYKEAIKLKKEKNYNIDIIGVSTFDEVLEYLNNIK